MAEPARARGAQRDCSAGAGCGGVAHQHQILKLHNAGGGDRGHQIGEEDPGCAPGEPELELLGTLDNALLRLLPCQSMEGLGEIHYLFNTTRVCVCV